MLDLVFARLKTDFSPLTVLQGEDCYKRGLVLSFRLSEGLFKARVRGDTGQLFDVFVDLRDWPKNAARCGCRTSDCKHFIAALYAFRAREPGQVLQEPPVVSFSIQADAVEWYTDLHVRSTHFFAYELGILVNGNSVNLVPLMLNCLQHYGRRQLEAFSDEEMLTFMLGREQRLQVPMGRLRPFFNLLLHEGVQMDKAEPALSLQAYQLLLLDDLEKQMRVREARWQSTYGIQATLALLRDRTTLPVISVPTNFKASLRDYQQIGLNWLQCLREHRFGGVLADDMGLGKTIQTLAHLLVEKEAGRAVGASLIVAPTSLLANWFSEAQRFAPTLNVAIYHGTNRNGLNFAEQDVVITTYGLLHRDRDFFAHQKFYYVILDEAQFIKNARTRTMLACLQLHAEHRLCLTGTPLQNHLGELWSLFDFLMPGFLGDARYFRKHYRIPIEKQNDEAIQQQLMSRMEPFLLRRTKNLVAQELPEKTEMIHTVVLSGPQRDLYEGIRVLMEKKVREAIAALGVGKSQMVFLDALLKLRQVCCDPRLLSIPEARMADGHSAKLNALMTLLDNLMLEGRRVLVFSQFTSMLRLIEAELIARGYPYLQLTGKTRDRQRVVNDFQEKKAPIFLISLKAGGVGLNLTQADTVIHYDPWWNPAVEAQATDRSHRIGQCNPVFVYKLVASGTVEEAIQTMQVHKQQLFDTLLSHPEKYVDFLTG